MLPRETARTFKKWLTTAFILLLFSSAGCTKQNGTVAMVTTAVVTSTLPTTVPTESATPTLTAVITPLPILTLTPTATTTRPPSLTPTPTATPFPTLTPLPTIPPEQRGQAYADLMSTNGGCDLPCWWGFEMGVASLDEVRQFYTTFDAYISEWQEFDPHIAVQDRILELTATFVDPQINEGMQTRHRFFAQRGVVIEVETTTNYEPEYQIAPILQQLGQPAEISMWTVPDVYEGILPAIFRFYFPEKGVMVVYGTGGVRVNDTVNICFDGFDGREGAILHLWNPSIWNPEGNKGIAERADGSSAGLISEVYPIDEVSNWDVEAFYTILANPAHTECLETPANLWPAP